VNVSFVRFERNPYLPCHNMEWVEESDMRYQTVRL